MISRNQSLFTWLLSIVLQALTISKGNVVVANIISKAPHVCQPRRFEIEQTDTCSVPIDDTVSAQILASSLWSVTPECKTSLRSETQKYCIFTARHFGNHGISLVSLPHMASDIVPILENLEGVLTTLMPAPSNEQPYEVRSIPGRGEGLVATRRLEEHETVLVDHTALLLDVSFPDAVESSVMDDMLETAVSQLSKSATLIMALGTVEGWKGNHVQGLLRTNALTAEVLDTTWLSLFPLTSKVNHECKPNSFLRYSPDSLAVGLTTHRVIEPGEELTISYLPVDLPSSMRQIHLTRWGFECTCSLCTADKEAIEASDSRRKALRSLHPRIANMIRESNHKETLSLSYEMIDILREEDLGDLLGIPYEVLARTYDKMGDGENAKKYAEKTLRLWSTYAFLGGVEKGRSQDLERIIRDQAPQEG